MSRRNTSGNRLVTWALLLLIIFVGDVITGGIGIASPVTVAVAGCNNPPSLEQCGTGTCTIPTNTIDCTITKNFAPAFAHTPGSTKFWLTGSLQSIGQARFLTSDVQFESDNATTWHNFPVAETELYGTIFHEAGLDPALIPSTSQAQFLVVCFTGSSSGTAILRPQFFDSLSNTWTDLAQHAGGLDVSPVGCATFTDTLLESGVDSVNPDFFSSLVTLRVVGLNGGGAGDSILLNNIHVQFVQTESLLPACSIIALSTTAMTIDCVVILRPVNVATVNLGFDVLL